MPNDSVRVASAGTVPLSERCPACDEPMMYLPGEGTMFCPNIGGECAAALKERPILKPAEADPRAGERCDECDPSFGCFDGSAPCRKQPLPEAKASETTSDNAARLLYDVLEVVGPLGAMLREYPSDWLKKKGAELIALWRRGEHLGVLKSERP